MQSGTSGPPERIQIVVFAAIGLLLMAGSLRPSLLAPACILMLLVVFAGARWGRTEMDAARGPRWVKLRRVAGILIAGGLLVWALLRGAATKQ